MMDDGLLTYLLYAGAYDLPVGTMTASPLSTMNYLLSVKNRLPGWSDPCRRFGSRGQATRINQLIAGRPTAPRPLPPRAESGCS